MDNRLKFLYCMMTELWGHRQDSTCAGNGKAGASGGSRVRQEKPPVQVRSRDAERNKSSEAVRVWLSRKAAIV